MWNSCQDGWAGLQLLQLKNFYDNHFNDWINYCIARHCFMTPQITTITTDIQWLDYNEWIGLCCSDCNDYSCYNSRISMTTISMIGLIIVLHDIELITSHYNSRPDYNTVNYCKPSFVTSQLFIIQREVFKIWNWFHIKSILIQISYFLFKGICSLVICPIWNLLYQYYA